MDFSNRRILIAGGAGFIGTNLALRLARAGAHLRLTRRDKPLQVEIPGVEIVPVDLRQAEDCVRAVEGMDFVLHLPARYEDETEIVPIVEAAARFGQPSQVEGIG